MTNQDIANIFYHIAEILEIQGENPFKIRAYIKAAQTVESYTKELSEIKDVEQLKELPGIGEKVALKIKELVETGKLEMYEKLKKSEIAPLIELLQVPGLGPKHVKLIYDKLGIKTIDQLEKAAKAGKLRGLPGLGEKTEQNILKGIDQERRHKERFPLGVILPRAESIVYQLKQVKEVKDINLGGSIRRMKETIGDVDILVSSTKAKKVSDAFVKLPEVQNIISEGATKSSVMTKDGFQIDLRVVKPESYGAALHYFTGSKAHNIRIRSLGIDRGLKINEYGVFKGKKSIAGKTEEEIFKSVGLPFIPPEIREDWGEIEAAQKGKLPHLIEQKDLKGDLHIHSNWTDGRSSIEDMALAARKMGYLYMALCDHSPTIGITNGLTPERIEKRKQEIDKVSQKLKGFVILNGAEVDIRSNGKMDFEDDVLKELEIVVAAVHTKFTQPKDEMTKRIIGAIENPYVDIIAHPTGRLIGRRDPYEVDMDKVLDAAKANHKIMELNAYPDRLDLNDLHCRKAKEKGVKIAISTDSHWTEHLSWIRYGIATARRGWLEPEDVVNTLPLEKLLKLFR
ncbi:MAG: DNA polymerase/3'-5' exonuclease PolX [candidate division Zixibacteria bacterium]|nr:DNA polymerase/3'-5' exonuclease PolX [candidate division Zixibacteria bacterium]